MTLQTQVRCAGAGDLEGVLALYAELRPHDPPLTPEQRHALWLEVNAGPQSRVVVALRNGEVAATCMLATLANLASGGRRIGLIEHVITAARHRRLGLARQVLDYALDLAWREGCCKVMLLSGLQRSEAHRLYESAGFQGDVERGFVIKPPASRVATPGQAPTSSSSPNGRGTRSCTPT